MARKHRWSHTKWILQYDGTNAIVTNQRLCHEVTSSPKVLTVKKKQSIACLLFDVTLRANSRDHRCRQVGHTVAEDTGDSTSSGASIGIARFAIPWGLDRADSRPVATKSDPHTVWNVHYLPTCGQCKWDGRQTPSAYKFDGWRWSFGIWKFFRLKTDNVRK